MRYAVIVLNYFLKVILLLVVLESSELILLESLPFIDLLPEFFPLDISLNFIQIVLVLVNDLWSQLLEPYIRERPCLLLLGALPLSRNVPKVLVEAATVFLVTELPRWLNYQIWR